MEVVIDGVIYEYQTWGGISRLYNEVLPRMCAIDNSLQITLFTSGRVRQEALPTHSQIHHCSSFLIERFLRPRRLWQPIKPQVRALVQQWALRAANERSVWHSTYYTQLRHWPGPVVVTIYDMIYEQFPHLFHGPLDDLVRARKRQCISRADAVICISRATLFDVQEFYGLEEHRLHVVPLAPSSVFRRFEQAELDFLDYLSSPFLLYVGSRAHYKNFNALINAYSKWHRRQEVELVVVGKKWLENEQQSLLDLGIAGQVHLLTNVDDDNLSQLYNQAAAFIYPSLYEGFGIPLLEAMACGCPVVASCIPSTLEVARDCPIYFEPTDIDDLLFALDTALSEGRDSPRTQLGLQYASHYSWDETARRTLEVYGALSNFG